MSDPSYYALHIAKASGRWPLVSMDAATPLNIQPPQYRSITALRFHARFTRGVVDCAHGI